MRLEEYKVYERNVLCSECNAEFNIHIELPSEGHLAAPQFYECNICLHPYKSDEESEHYQVSLTEKLKTMSCFSCNEPLSKTLEKVKYVGHCNSCGNKKYKDGSKSHEVYFAIHNLYS